MIKDEIVTHPTAFLAKEIGFDVPCNTYFKVNDEEVTSGKSDLKYHNSPDSKSIVIRPTQSLLARWFREVHRIHVSVGFNVIVLEYSYKIFWFENNQWKRCDSFAYSTHELAYEAGLLKTGEYVKSKMK